MVQTSLFENPVYPPNPFKAGSQNHRIYERAKKGPLTNGEIVYGMRIQNSTGRCSEVRDFLKDYGFTFPCRSTGNGSEFVYEIGGRG